MVKCTAPPTLKYIAFDLQEVKVYKGEGSVNLTAYYPYALSTWETVFNGAASEGEVEWTMSNNGDLEAPFKIIFPTNLTEIQLTLEQDSNVIGTISLTDISKLGTDTYFCIDSRTNLIEGLNNSYVKTGQLYNRFITEGDFFKLPIGISKLTTSAPWNKIRYNFLYY